MNVARDPRPLPDFQAYAVFKARTVWGNVQYEAGVYSVVLKSDLTVLQDRGLIEVPEAVDV